MIVSGILRDIDYYLRAVAPVEHPCGAAPLAIDYRELLVDDEVDGGDTRGLSALGLDRWAAWIRKDESLVGRPVFALAVERALADAKDSSTPALVRLRSTALHELAHAIEDRETDATRNIDPETFVPALHRNLRAQRPAYRSRNQHGPRWWRTYLVLVARGTVIAPKLLPVSYLDPWVEMYGYAVAGDARRWIDAARTDAELLDLPIVDAAARRVPALDELFDIVSRHHAAVDSAAQKEGVPHARVA